MNCCSGIALAVDDRPRRVMRGRDVDDVVGARWRRPAGATSDGRSPAATGASTSASEPITKFGVALPRRLRPMYDQRDADDHAAEDDDVRSTARARLPVEGLRLLAGRLPGLVARPSRRRRRWPSTTKVTSATTASADAGVQHRRALAVRRLAPRVEEVARAGDDTAEDRLDLHGARAVVHLDLGAGARAPPARPTAAARTPAAGPAAGCAWRGGGGTACCCGGGA